MARLHHVTREQLLAARPPASIPAPQGLQWKAARPVVPTTGVRPWFDLTTHSPVVDSRVGDRDVSLSATLATFGGVTGPSPGASPLPDGIEVPTVVLGGNPVAPGTPAGPVVARTAQCTVRLRVAAERLTRGRQCLVIAAVCVLGPGDHYVQLLLGDAPLGEDRVEGEDRVAVLLDVPDDGRLTFELWLRLASVERDARLGVRGLAGHLL